MRPFIPFFLLFCLAFWGMPLVAQESHSPFESAVGPSLASPEETSKVEARRSLYLQIWHPNYGGEESKLTISFDKKGQDTSFYLREGVNIYVLQVPICEEYGFKLYEQQYWQKASLNAQEPLFITIQHPVLFPERVTAWDKTSMLQVARPITFRIMGEVPVVYRDKVKLHLPFHPWPGTASTQLAQTEAGGDDHRLVQFEVEGQISQETMVFLQVGPSYFPVLMTHDMDMHPYLSFREDKVVRGGVRPPLILDNMFEDEGETEIVPQFFVNQLFDHRGMNESRFSFFARAMKDSPLRNNEIRRWATELVDFEAAHHSETDFSPVMNVLHHLDDMSWRPVVHRAYESSLEQEYRRVHERSEVIQSFFTATHIFAVLFFLLVLVSKLIRPGSLLAAQFNRAEILVFASTWSIIAFSMFVQMRHDGIVELSTIGEWLLWMVAAAIAVINVRYIVPDIYHKKGRGQFFLHLGLMFMSVLLAMVFFQLSPLSDLYLLWIDGAPEVKNLYEFPYWHRHDEVMGLLMMTFILSSFYGLGRYYVVKRVPRLQRRNESLNAELNALKTQISPHFFFNSLNTVYSFSLEEESPRTSEALTRVSDLMRFVIYQADKEWIPLEQELDYLTDYVELQQLRLDPSKHDLQFRIDGEPGDLKIAPLLLISLIENAFKHGISMSEPSYIKIDILIQTKGLILTIENSNHAVKVLPSGESSFTQGGLGLVNIRKRLDLLYPKRYDWVIEPAADAYLTRLSLELAN